MNDFCYPEIKIAKKSLKYLRVLSHNRSNLYITNSGGARQQEKLLLLKLQLVICRNKKHKQEK